MGEYLDLVRRLNESEDGDKIIGKGVLDRGYITTSVDLNDAGTHNYAHKHNLSGDKISFDSNTGRWKHTYQENENTKPETHEGTGESALHKHLGKHLKTNAEGIKRNIEKNKNNPGTYAYHGHR